MATQRRHGASTPCIGICRIEADRCAGCGRTLAMIAAWGGMTETERLREMRRMSDRTTGETTPSG